MKAELLIQEEAGMRTWGKTLTASFALFAVQSPSFAASFNAAPPPSSLTASSAVGASVLPVVVFGEDARRTPEAFAEDHHLVAKEVVRSHTASGLVHCGNAHGAGQLTITDDVVTTAAHVFYDENGLLRAESCSFELTVNGAPVRVPVDLRTVVAGSTKPYDAEVTRDWAVARLSHAVMGVKPYGVAPNVAGNEPVTFVARGHIDWGDAKNLSMQTCMLHDHLSDGPGGTREFSFDCDTGDGASGGAVMFDRDSTRIGAILVGWRSNRPFSAVPFSRTHYNFAVTIEGDFRRAVYAAADKVLVQK